MEKVVQLNSVTSTCPVITIQSPVCSPRAYIQLPELCMKIVTNEVILYQTMVRGRNRELVHVATQEDTFTILIINDIIRNLHAVLVVPSLTHVTFFLAEDPPIDTNSPALTNHDLESGPSREPLSSFLGM